MIVVKDPYRASDLPSRGVATIGNFDGVHLGHQKMLRDVAERAKELGAPGVVVTFDPHPLKILHPEFAPKMLQTLRQREEAIEACGIDAVVLVPFTRDFSLTPAEDFVRDLLVRRLACREVHVGAHFVFGRGRGGDLELLKRIGEECGVVVKGISDVLDAEGPISSTRVRDALLTGAVEKANDLLGRPYAMDGLVEKGDRMGRRIGFPTLNLRAFNELYPKDGVYVGEVFIRSFERTFPCVTNIGRRPTVYEDYATTIESYVLDFSSDVYGEPIRLTFLKRLRDEETFPSMLELTAQIGRDVEETRRYFAARPAPALP
ncbi:MAG TPA: bifunctional riboflavin kinase/FAD synthetase [Thermoanaerobaculia bacterium]|nr:bifunctional riboflavin kinase/FAD synthetase [Thermoanaerobaculia bacterium]